jgi:uncharacterized protein YraI
MSDKRKRDRQRYDAVTTDDLNFRDGPSTSATIIATIPKGTVVRVRDDAGDGWFLVSHNGRRGYSHGGWLMRVSDVPTPTPTPQPGGGVPATAYGARLAARIGAYVGYPYRWNTRGPNTFDCSGLIYWVYLDVLGRTISPSSYTQWTLGIFVPKDQLQPGDVLFYSPDGDVAGHVGMFEKPGSMINALNESAGVVRSDPFSSYFAPIYLGARRI